MRSNTADLWINGGNQHSSQYSMHAPVTEYVRFSAVETLPVRNKITYELHDVMLWFYANTALSDSVVLLAFCLGRRSSSNSFTCRRYRRSSECWHLLLRPIEVRRESPHPQYRFSAYSSTTKPGVKNVHETEFRVDNTSSSVDVMSGAQITDIWGLETGSVFVN